MKAVSVCQPWASLIVHGLKRLETRCWATPHRGALAIHASKCFPPAARMLCLQEPYRTLLAGAGLRDWRDLPTGLVLGVVEVLGCTRVPEMEHIPELESQLGDFGRGQWAWLLANARPLPEPVPCRGRLGLFDVPDPAVPASQCA
jgi:activating signal cointegrator 1